MVVNRRKSKAKLKEIKHWNLQDFSKKLKHRDGDREVVTHGIN